METKADLEMQLGGRDFKSEFLLVHLRKLRCQSFSDRLNTEEPVSVLLVVTRAESNCCKLALKKKHRRRRI